MSFFDNILNFITDSNKRLSAKATIVVLTVIALLLTDNIIGFSHYYNNQRQLEQLKSISTLLKDSTLNSETKKNLLELQKTTFTRKNILEKSIDFMRGLKFNLSDEDENASSKVEGARNDFWFLMSTSGLYILITILLIPVLLITDKKTPFLKLVATLIIFSLVMAFTSWFNYWLFELIIPDRLFGNWIWNYVINAIIQIGLIVGLTWTTNTINRSVDDM